MENYITGQQGDTHFLRPYPTKNIYCGITNQGTNLLLGPVDEEHAYFVHFDKDGAFMKGEERLLPVDRFPYPDCLQSSAETRIEYAKRVVPSRIENENKLYAVVCEEL